MKTLITYFNSVLMLLLLSSCGEEIINKGTIHDSFTAEGVISMSSEECGGFHYVKPPVDILFIIDNSGSINNERFSQIRAQIGNTISTISQDFDYHIYVAPLLKGSESNTSYPLLVSDPSSVEPSYAINITTIENLPNFTATGNNLEAGIDRARELINDNKASSLHPQKIFRQNSNLITVIISTEDDNSFCKVENIYNCEAPAAQAQLTAKINNLYSLKATLNSEVFRFISLVPFSNCSPFQTGYYYRNTSSRIYAKEGLSDDNTYRDSRNLCSGNYSNLFQAVNSSIKKVLVGHSYDHWAINPNDIKINENNIDLKKRLTNGNLISLIPNLSNGFQLLPAEPGHNTGYRENFNILKEPSDRQELRTGLIVKLNGSAQVTYPECIISKTKTPVEYYGYVVLSRKPDLSTVQVKINGNSIPESAINGWKSYNNNTHTPNQNIKIQGPIKNPINPYAPDNENPIKQSGYVLKLMGSAVYNSSDSIQIDYKPASL